MRGGGSLVRGSGNCSRRKEGETPPEGLGAAVLDGACGVVDTGGGVRLGGDGVDCDRDAEVGAGGGRRDNHGARVEDAERADDDDLGGVLSAMDVVLTQEEEEAEVCALIYGD